MRKLLFTLLILGFLGCATVPTVGDSILDGMMKQLEEPEEPPVEIENRDWYPMDVDGYAWGLQDATGVLIGRCYYTYMRVSSVEQWRGVFYQKTTDFSWNPYYSVQTDGLYECVNWVEQLALGGYYS